MTLKTIEWKDNSVIMIDQTKLPNILEYVTYTDYNQVADAIRTLVVRGAPAIGVSGAFGLALAALQSDATEKEGLINYLENAKKILFETRPTAVNLASVDAGYGPPCCMEGQTSTPVGTPLKIILPTLFCNAETILGFAAISESVAMIVPVNCPSKLFTI